MKILFRLCLMGIFLSALSIKAFADNSADVNQMMNKSLDDLMNTKVTSATGREQKMNDVANAMYVITKEDIERSGARNVADLLYRVPGLEVREVDGHNYEVGIHGNGSIFVNNLLVLIDGVVVFNPAFSKVDWDNLPISLNEIERIEIIRGSAGVLYSSNAVNGTINIISKSADAKDNYVQQEGGTQSYRESSIGVGEKIGTTGLALRTYLDNDFNQGFTKTTSGRISDRYLSDSDGLRADYTPNDHQRLTISANNNQRNSNDVGGLGAGPGGGASVSSAKNTGETASVLVNYTDKVSDVYDYSIHVDHVDFTSTFTSINDSLIDATSASTQHNFHYDLAGSHVTSLGSEWRYNQVEESTTNSNFPLTSGTQKIISFFAQDEYHPIEKLILTAGVREDRNTLIIDHKPLFSPIVSALYHVTEDHSFWASSGKTYRTPDFIDNDLAMSIGKTLKPEEVSTQEIGYRGLFLDKKLSMDDSIFLKQVKDVIEIGTGGEYNNGGLVSRGAEMALDYQLTDELSLSTDYSYILADAKPETAMDSSIMDLETGLSKNIVGIGTRYTKNRFKFDLYAKYFEGYSASSTKVRGYYKTFLRISYDFKTPSYLKWVGQQDATVFLDVDDSLGAHQIQDTYKVYVEPEVFAGIKIKF